MVEGLRRRALFARSMILHPGRVGAVWPTSRFAVRDLLDMADLPRAQRIAEFGVGTGVYTEEALRRLPPDATLLAFEVDGPLAEAVAGRLGGDRRLRVVRDSAENVEAYLGGERLDAIVCSLPFTSLPREVTRRVLLTAQRTLAPDGRLLVLQYSGAVLPELRRHFATIERRVSPLNLPPAFLFSCSSARAPESTNGEAGESSGGRPTGGGPRGGRALMTRRSWAAARPYVLAPALAGALLLAAGWRRSGVGALAAAGASLLFFRDPERALDPQPGEVYAAADGFVRELGEVEEPMLPGGRGLRVSTFLSLHNVHVNRSPVAGRVARMEEVRGGYAPALLARADGNKRLRSLIEGENGPVVVVQKSGAVARRISPWVRPGDRVEAGERIGIIHFGSRTDVVLPVGAADPLVAVGDRVRTGLTPIARYRGSQP